MWGLEQPLHIPGEAIPQGDVQLSDLYKLGQPDELCQPIPCCLPHLKATEGSTAEDGAGFFRRVYKRLLKETATKPRVLGKRVMHKGRAPVIAVCGEQFVLTVCQHLAPRVVGCQGGQVDLHADELGSLRLTVLPKPVGIGQPWPVVFGARANGGHEGFLRSVHAGYLIPPASNEERK
jgi:hypothetical protein